MNALVRRYHALRERVLPAGSVARAVYDRVTWAILRRVRRHVDAVVQRDELDPSYARWRTDHAAGRAELHRMRHAASPWWPTMSVIIVAGPGQKRSLLSIERQVYSRRQVCTASTLSSALALATGDFVVFLRTGDELSPDALWRYAERAAKGVDDIVYADEDCVDGEGRHHKPFFKPDWSPELLLSFNYIGNAFAARRSLVAFQATDRFDLLLQMTETTTRIGHLPHVLYHSHHASAEFANRHAIEAAVQRRGRLARVVAEPEGRFRVKYAIEGRPRVAIIVPTRDRIELLRTTIESIDGRSTYREFEIIVIDNGSREPASLEYLSSLQSRHRVLCDPSPFNWSSLNNRAALQTNAPLLLFLNNDVEVIAADWLEALIEHAQHPEVGAVGAKLLYPDGKIQHAGVVMGIGGLASHAFRTRLDDGGEYHGLSSVVREYSAVTGACLMTRREVFEAAGGFDEELGIAYNDVDFCLRLGARGLRTVYTPYAKLFHYESATRGVGHPPENEALLVNRWHAQIANEP